MFGIWFAKEKPSGAVLIPGVLKVDVPLIEWTGYMIIALPILTLAVKVEI
jgi:hypothetical protein